MPLKFVIDARRIRDFGIGTYIRNLVHALAALDSENQYFLAIRSEDKEEVADLPANFHSAIYNRPDKGRLEHISFPMFVRSFGADLFHIPLNNVPLFMPKPYVVTVHDLSSLLFQEQRDFQKGLRSVRFRRGLLRADKVITVSAATRRDVSDLLGIPLERIRVIYSAPDPAFSDPAPDPSAQRLEQRRILERYQISYPFLLYAGNIRPQKNIPRLVEAFAVLRGELESHPLYSGLRLIIIGDEILKHPDVRHAVIQTRMEQSVRFLGFVPISTLRVFYETAAAFVFPSLYEGFGLPPLEAMAVGTPVVTSNVSSLPEAVDEAAVSVNPENVFDIARGIRDVLLNHELRASLIERGRHQAARFRWERTAKETLETYLEISKPGKRRI
jgi:glycosyltransferase involved in cell wall biosynthesis